MKNDNNPTVPDIPNMAQVLRKVRVPQEAADRFQHVTLPFELRPHQYTSLQGILAWNRMGLFDEPRLGKSVCMHLAATYYAYHGVKSVLLMPPTLFDQFLEEFNKLGNHGLDLMVLDGSPIKRTKDLIEVRTNRRRGDVIAMTKEIFKKEIDDLLSLGYSSMMFDECHMGLQSETEVTKKRALTTYGSVKKFVDRSDDHRLVLSTGTPIMNELKGTYPIISLKTPEAYRSRNDFDYQHVTFNTIMIRSPRGMRQVRVSDPDRYRNTDLLHKNLYANATRALQLDVLDIDVPNIQQIPVHLSTTHMKLYRKVMKDKIIEVGDKLVDARQQTKLRMFGLQMITDPGIASDRPPKNLVLEAVQTLLDSIDVKHNKVLLFANFNHSVEFLASYFKKLNPAVVYGPASAKKKNADVKRFKEDKDCRILIANPASGGVGLTLGHVSQNVIFVEPVSVPGVFSQAASRIILSGQTKPVKIYLLRVAGTISPKSIDAMLGKADTSKEVLADSKSMLDHLLGQD